MLSALFEDAWQPSAGEVRHALETHQLKLALGSPLLPLALLPPTPLARAPAWLPSLRIVAQPQLRVQCKGTRGGHPVMQVVCVQGGQAVACGLAEGGRVLLGHPRSVPSVRRALEAAVAGGEGPPRTVMFPLDKLAAGATAARAAMARLGRVAEGPERNLLATLGLVQSTAQGGVLTAAGRALGSPDSVVLTAQKWGPRPPPLERAVTVLGAAPHAMLRVEDGSNAVQLEHPVDAAVVKAWMSWLMFEAQPSVGGVRAPVR